MKNIIDANGKIEKKREQKKEENTIDIMAHMSAKRDNIHLLSRLPVGKLSTY